MSYEPTTRELAIELKALKELLQTSLAWQKERAEMLAEQYRQDKGAQNEWRGTVNDLLSVIKGRLGGISAAWGVLISILSVGIAVYAAIKP